MVGGTALPTWVNSVDAERLAAYQLYEDIYWTSPETFKILQRGTEGAPLYLPSGRIIVNTMNRYVGKAWSFAADPELGSDSEKEALQLAFTDLFRRERMKAQYVSNKLYGLIRGDWVWYITANPDKLPLTRITVRGIHPGMYFPIEDPADPDRILGVDLAEPVVIGDGTYIKRQRYLKPGVTDETGFTNTAEWITYQVDTFELDGWEDPEERTVFPGGTNEAPITLDGIPNLPFYHIKNIEQPGSKFGSSEMRGLERIFAGMNQSITDEELTLALEGLGLYVTDSGAPIDDEGNEVPWMLGPGRVVEVGAGRAFNRISGVGSVTPSLDHIRFVQDQAFRVTGASDVAQGIVDVSVAESGIALTLRMAPIIEAAEDKEAGLRDTLNQMLFDLKTWLQVYEGINTGVAQPISTFADKLPIDKDKKFAQLMQMYTSVPPLISGDYFLDEMRKMGWEIPKDMMTAIVAEQLAFATETDPYAGRLGEEAAGATDALGT